MPYIIPNIWYRYQYHLSSYYISIKTRTLNNSFWFWGFTHWGYLTKYFSFSWTFIRGKQRKKPHVSSYHIQKVTEFRIQIVHSFDPLWWIWGSTHGGHHKENTLNGEIRRCSFQWNMFQVCSLHSLEARPVLKRGPYFGGRGNGPYSSPVWATGSKIILWTNI